MTATHSREPENQSASDLAQFDAAADLWAASAGTVSEKVDAFPKFASRQAIAKFLARYEIFKRILHVNGSIVECGVLYGGGVLTWAKLSSILEPVNHPRRVIGFDTFEGFPSIHEKDEAGTSVYLHEGGLTGSTQQDVEAAIGVYDLNRPLAHIPKIELIKGDIAATAPAYVEANPHLVVSMLYLDVDLYEPTKVALETFLPLMPKGAVVVFDELNAHNFPGETRAVDDVLGIKNLHIERLPFDSYVSFAVLT